MQQLFYHDEGWSYTFLKNFPKIWGQDPLQTPERNFQVGTFSVFILLGFFL